MEPAVKNLKLTTLPKKLSAEQRSDIAEQAAKASAKVRSKKAQKKGEHGKLTGMAQRLIGKIPAGYHWDDAKRRCVQNPPPPAPPRGAICEGRIRAEYRFSRK